jgi:hypothetical protein
VNLTEKSLSPAGRVGASGIFGIEILKWPSSGECCRTERVGHGSDCIAGVATTRQLCDLPSPRTGQNRLISSN